MGEIDGAAVVDGDMAYFSSRNHVYSYTIAGNTWTKLPECKYQNFEMAVIRNKLATIGGRDCQWVVTNSVLSLSGSSWEEVLPPMPTNRVSPAAAASSTHLVVAGGRQTKLGGSLATVDVLDTETLQWYTVGCLPETILYPQMTMCGGWFYLIDDRNTVFSCSVEDLLESTNSSDGHSVWTRLASIPTPQHSYLAAFKGRVLAIGGMDGNSTTGAIHCYDVTTNSWSIISEMPTARSRVLTAVLPSNQLVVVGGALSGSYCSTTEIGSH
jgi:N-acetylneuraminic acid mutarotase